MNFERDQNDKSYFDTTRRNVRSYGGLVLCSPLCNQCTFNIADEEIKDQSA